VLIGANLRPVWLIALAMGSGCGGDGRAGDPGCRITQALTFQWTGAGAPDTNVRSLVPPDVYAESTAAGAASCRGRLAACGSAAGITPKDVSDAVAAEDVEAAWPGTTAGMRFFQRSGGMQPDFAVSALGRGTLVFTASCAGKDDCRTQTSGLASLEDLLQQVIASVGPSCK
jgi:hypothetical protein